MSLKVATTTTAIVAGLAVGLFALYKTVIPPKNIPMGNLSHVKRKPDEEKLAYYPDYFDTPLTADLPYGKVSNPDDKLRPSGFGQIGR
jgi:hypothetical protein